MPHVLRELLGSCLSLGGEKLCCQKTKTSDVPIITVDICGTTQLSRSQERPMVTLHHDNLEPLQIGKEALELIGWRLG
eukprot:6171790-Amphidinium_carterae.1